MHSQDAEITSPFAANPNYSQKELSNFGNPIEENCQESGYFASCQSIHSTRKPSFRSASIQLGRIPETQPSSPSIVAVER
jgi:hypothetical protein